MSPLEQRVEGGAGFEPRYLRLVLAAALPKAPPAHIDPAGSGRAFLLKFIHDVYPQYQPVYSKPEVYQLIRWPSWAPCTGVNAGSSTGNAGRLFSGTQPLGQNM